MNDAPLSSSNYTVACICSMGVELAPVRAMLDETYPSLPIRRDENSYTLGKIGEHNIVIAIMPEAGNNRAAIVATQLLNEFPSIRFFLLVGIGGGVPGEKEGQNDIRLGDVVVSRPTATFGGVVQYDLGKAFTNHFERTGLLCKPPAILLANVGNLEAKHRSEGSRIPQYLSEMMRKSPQMEGEYKYPGAEHDNLFGATYLHQHGKVCTSCDTGQLVQRKDRSNSDPQIHYGTIGSANAVIKDGATRERLRQDLNIMCVEMEAAGLMDTFPCLVIRGICDYADSHKNDRWQPYAAATAAAYMKELLLIIPPREVAEEVQIRDTIADMKVTVKSIEEIVTMVRSENSMKVMDRLSSVDFWGKQHDVYSRAQEGTGTWILEDPTFKSWLAEQHGILWCTGVPGAGKTILASIIIDHLVKMFETDNVGLAWLYMDYRGHDLQTMENLFASLLRQLVQKQGKILDSIIRSFGVSWKEAKLNLGECKTLLQEELHQFRKTIIVIDALDESSTKDLRKMLISELRALKPPILLLVMSRPLQDIGDILGDASQIEIRARNEDVNLCLERHLQGSVNLRGHLEADPSLQELIKNLITQSDDGMFLKAMLKLRSLAELKNPGEVKKSLMNLPNTYDEIYEFNIKRIENQDEVHRERAFQVLSWLSYALAPLTVTALQHALLVKSGDVELRKDAQPDDNALVSICADLVVIDPETNIIRLVHETAQDYLKKVRPKKFPDGHSIISSASLAYLSLGEFSELCSSQIEVDKRSEKYPFYRYAAQYWPQHVNLGGLESSLQGLIVAFLGSRQRYSADEVMASHRWSVWGSDNAGPWTDWNRLSIQRRDHPQHAAATYGLLNTLNFLLNKRGYKIDQPNNFGETALHRAAQVGHATIIEELLASGAELNAKVKQHYLGQATPMILASKCLQVDAVRVLSNYGADVNSFDPQNRYIPLHFAASTSTELTRILLDHGAYPNFQAIRSPSFPERGPMTSLHFSVYFSHAYEGARDRVKLLLDRGANVNAQTGLGNTALHIAILGGHQGLLDLLLQRGADVQLKNMEGKSVPQLAQELGHFSWVKGQVPRQILDDQLRKTPALHQAIWDKDHPLILRLLKQGADIAEKDESGNTPWDYCLMSTNLDLAKILVDHMYSNNLPKQIGSEAFDKGITQMTAFDYTDIKTWEGTLQICRLLLPFRKAFDGDLQFAKARSPLPFPRAFDGALQLAKAPSPPIGYNKTFFIWAAELGRTSLVEFLLECGADVNAQDIYGSTATHYAVSGNNIEIVNILVKNGANLRLQARNGHTPVMGADTGGFFKMKTYLEAALAVQADQS